MAWLNSSAPSSANSATFPAPLGNVDQSYSTSGFISYKASGGVKSRTYGASYYDNVDVCDCDANLEIVCDDAGEK
ncbi:MAG UNVERIFIED_CONTAM: hypothetical protein LVR18_04710 [Planctomycetaceae bacterium]